MPFQSLTFVVLIASPSDLPEEREAAKQAIHDWNDLNAEAERVVLLPKMWESHAVPSFGDRAQGIINEQLVKDADLLIGMFWTRFGSDTGVAPSGTVEEIDQIVAADKPAQLYFSTRPVDLAKVDLKQVETLREYQKKTYAKALVGTFSSPSNLRDVLLRDLTRRVRMMQSEDQRKEAESRQLIVTVTCQKEQSDDELRHVRYLQADLLNHGLPLNDVAVTLDYTGKDGKPKRHVMHTGGDLPNPFATGFSCRAGVVNADPTTPLEVLADVPPEKIAVVVHSRAREVVRLPATQWLEALEAFRKADPTMPAPPPPKPEPRRERGPLDYGNVRTWVNDWRDRW